METKTSLQEHIDTLKIEYSAEFVPLSRSRNKDEEHPTLNWVVTLKRGHAEIKTDYMQGIAHHPYYKQSWGKPSYEERQHMRGIEKSAEDGKLHRITPNGFDLPKIFKGSYRLPAPALKDVLQSLLLDSEVMNYGGFKEWATETGYDTDSRQGENIYRACLEIGLKFNQMFDCAERGQLAEVYQDY